MKKSIWKSGIMNAAMGIGIASFIFGAVGFLIDRSSQGNFVLTHYAYSRMGSASERRPQSTRGATCRFRSRPSFIWG